MTNYDNLNPAELAELAPDGPDWDAWRAAHPDEAAEIEVGRRVRALLVRLQAADVPVPAGFEARLLERVRADKTLLDLLDLGLAGIGRSVVELLNLVFGLLPDPDGPITPGQHSFGQMQAEPRMDFQIVVDALTQIVLDIVNFIPKLINGLIILLVGYLVARLVRWIIATVLRQLRFDPLVERTGITGSLRGLGVKMALSAIVAQTVFALLLISFLISSTRLMGLEAVAQLLEELLLFLPSVIAAVIIFLLGGIVAQFVGNTISTVALSGGLTYGRRLGRIVQYLISLFVVVLALGQLGIDTGILVTAITIMIASFGLALSLALGFGARDVVRHILAGYYLRQRFAVGQPIVFGAVQGEIGGVGGVSTRIIRGDGSVVVPNTTLLESVVEAPGISPAAPPTTPPV